VQYSEKLPGKTYCARGLSFLLNLTKTIVISDLFNESFDADGQARAFARPWCFNVLFGNWVRASCPGCALNGKPVTLPYAAIPVQPPLL
jgi:hypothetical protein